ncbi:hypothetical protein [Micrococcus cohnii]|uniref:Uncharacterized protein n=1 Tax=Micrococcus cohnii TaxID=993416 RepID=A0A7W7DX17_9MICC|nr:hypothetical protein [Micrococcus cohnii]MBB4734493.1 hypothetical protein [Micrococcus cohnii]
MSPPLPLSTQIDALRRLLREERDRLRPDCWSLAWEMTERTAQLLPSWEGLRADDAASCLDVEDVVGRYLPDALTAFLAIPDRQKPAAADELLAQLTTLDHEHLRATRRLGRRLRSRLRAAGEVAALRFPQHRATHQHPDD